MILKVIDYFDPCIIGYILQSPVKKESIVTVL